MKNEQTNKSMTKKIIIVLFVLAILILLFIYVYNRVNTNTATDTTANTENLIGTNEENTTLVAEATGSQEDETWEWQHDTPENHNMNPTVLDTLHTELDAYPINAEVIIKDSVIVDEYYKEGYDQNSVFTLQSTSKKVLHLH